MEDTSELVSASRRPAMFQVMAGWILCVLLALVFLMVGGMKLMSRPIMVRELDQVGLGQWFRYLTGTLEVTAAIGLLIPKLSWWAALLLAVVMVGALIAHLTVLHSSPALAVILLVLTTVTVWLRRSQAA